MKKLSFSESWIKRLDKECAPSAMRDGYENLYFVANCGNYPINRCLLPPENRVKLWLDGSMCSFAIVSSNGFMSCPEWYNYTALMLWLDELVSNGDKFAA